MQIKRRNEEKNIMPKCPICKKEYVKPRWLAKHLAKLNGEEYSVSGISIAKKRPLMEFLTI